MCYYLIWEHCFCLDHILGKVCCTWLFWLKSKLLSQYKISHIIIVLVKIWCLELVYCLIYIWLVTFVQQWTKILILDPEGVGCYFCSILFVKYKNGVDWVCFLWAASFVPKLPKWFFWCSFNGTVWFDSNLYSFTMLEYMNLIFSWFITNCRTFHIPGRFTILEKSGAVLSLYGSIQSWRGFSEKSIAVWRISGLRRR